MPLTLEGQPLTIWDVNDLAVLEDTPIATGVPLLRMHRRERVQAAAARWYNTRAPLASDLAATLI